jgi:hypothetical protein
VQGSNPGVSALVSPHAERGEYHGLRRAAFAFYLVGLALLPVRWLSPLGAVQGHADWTDLLMAVSGGLWLVEKWRSKTLARSIRSWHVPLAVYLVWAALSDVANGSAYGGSFTAVILMVELALLAVLTADFAQEAVARRAIARVITASALGTVVLAVLGLALFYLGVRTGLLGVYGEQLTPSHLYARVRAGFESPPLLASFCIFASGVVASEEAALPRKLRIGTQVSLALLCTATVSRGLLGFLLAVVIRRSPRFRGRWRVVVPIAAVAVTLAILGALTVGQLHVDATKASPVSYVVPDPGNRREAFVTSFQTLKRHPLFGIGPGALPGVNAGVPFRAHFTPLNIAATLGLPALLAFGAMLGLIWKSRPRPTQLALWSALAGIAVDGLAQDIDHFRHVWVLLGLLGRGDQESASPESFSSGSQPAVDPAAPSG